MENVMKAEGLAPFGEVIRKAGVVFLVGKRGRGKTTLLMKLVGILRRKGVEVGGVLSPRIVHGGETVGYLVRDIADGREEILCSLEPPGFRFRRFYFRPEGIEFGRRAILEATKLPVLVVDEVGPLELTGRGFAPALREALRERVGGSTIIAVRPGILGKVRSSFGIHGARIYRI